MVWRGNRSESTDQLEPDVEREPLHPDDEPDEYADRSIFATGWFRALLVLAGWPSQWSRCCPTCWIGSNRRRRL
jgi:hypothetical protein